MEPGPGIRRSAYEPGLWFVSAEPGTTLQDHGTQWQIGSRYTLVRVLGYGSFSAVCLAVDQETGEKVALKRVADVLQSPEATKRVLREICILRRLRHPNLIGIRDAFVRPSATGQCRLIGGKLVNLSVDVYIAMELADGGDLFHLRGQMSGEEVRSLVWQLIVTIKYLHSLHVWHRDMKSQNVFLVRESGERVIKIGDFGSARSATPEGYQWVEQSAPTTKGGIDKGARRAGLAELHNADSYQAMDEAIQPEDLYLQHEPADGQHGSKTGFKAPLTRVVATPCYRAPEVVMSRGGYTASIDMWSLGCIFGELLQRIAHVGSAATPNLQVAPLFAIHGLPKTPDAGESFTGGPGSEITRRELQALFSVVGTPCWADVAAVQEPSWRRYLHHLPGRAPTLYRRFAAAGEAAVDLLSRLLAFDPTRRCSPDEALAHEYFSGVVPEGGGLEDSLGSPAEPQSRRSAGTLADAAEGGDAAAAGCVQPAAAALHDDEGGLSEPPTPLSALQPYSITVVGISVADAEQARVAAGQHAAARLQREAATAAAALEPTPSSLAGPFASRLHVACPAGASGSGGSEDSGSACPDAIAAAAADSMPEVAAAAADTPMVASESDPRPRGAGRGEGGAAGTAGTAHYWEESEPGRALSMLEDELSQISACYSTASPEDEGCQKMRQMLEEECIAIRASHGQDRSGTPARGGSGTAAAAGGGSGGGGGGSSCKKRARVLHTGGPDQSILASMAMHRGEGLQEDAGAFGEAFLDANRYAQQRLSNVADTWQGRELDPSRILGRQRHGEWFQSQAVQGPAPGASWGVTSLPPGMDPSKVDPKLLAIMRAQQGR